MYGKPPILELYSALAPVCMVKSFEGADRHTSQLHDMLSYACGLPDTTLVALVLRRPLGYVN